MRFLLEIIILCPIALVLLLLGFFKGFYIPLPCPAFLIPSDKMNLERASCFRFKGKLYVVGGYRVKKVPKGYRFLKVSWLFGEHDAGWHYRDKYVRNRRLFEITDEEEAFTVEYRLRQYKYAAVLINPETWKDIGQISSSKVIRDSEYYLELEGNLYANTGTSRQAEEYEDIQHSDIWMSSDLIKWRRVAPGNAISTEKGNTHASVWRNNEGRYFHITGESILFVSEDGNNWYQLLDISHALKIFQDKLAMIIPNNNGERSNYNVYLSNDGLQWCHTKTGEVLSLTPRDVYEKVYGDRLLIADYVFEPWTTDGDYDRFAGFHLVEFQNALWLIGKNADRLFKSSDGHNWQRLNLTKGQRFIPRSKMAIGVYNGYLWIMGGTWQGSVSLGDIWRSSDGQNWELVIDKAPWGTTCTGTIITAKGRMYLIKEGVQWDANNIGVIGYPREIWSTTDGLKWQLDSGDANNIIIQTCNPDNIDRVVETTTALYFLDDQYHQRFLREHSADQIQATFLLDNSPQRNVIEVRPTGQSPVFVSVEHNYGFLLSYDLIHWEYCVLQTEIDQTNCGSGLNFLLCGDCSIRYKPVIFRNKLFVAGVDFMTQEVYSTELLLDVTNESIEQICLNDGKENGSGLL